MSEKDTVTYTAEELKTRKSKTDFDRLDAMTEEEVIEASQQNDDLQETLGNWYDSANLVDFKKTKQQLTLRLDPDVIAWYKSFGKGYQTRMSEVLRAYMQHTKKSATTPVPKKH